jgi:hypothetical protein
MIEFRTKFCKDWSRRKKTYKENQIALFCANKPSEVYPNTLPPIPYPLYPTPYIYSLRTFVYIYQIYIYIYPQGLSCLLKNNLRLIAWLQLMKQQFKDKNLPFDKMLCFLSPRWQGAKISRYNVNGYHKISSIGCNIHV